MPVRSAHSSGILLMIVAMLLFAITDLAIKLASGLMAEPQVIFVLGLSGTVTFAGLALLRGLPLFPPEVAHPAVLSRNVSEVVGGAAIVGSLSLAPLTVVGAILQAAPLVVMAGAAIFLNEPVGWRRWSAAIVGFLGVLIVLQPWNDGLTFGALLAVVAVLALSGRDLLNRRAPRSLPTLVLAAHGLGSLLILGSVWSLAGPGALLPSDPPWVLIAVMSVVGTGAYFAITASVRAAPIAVIAPFRYTRLPFLAALGILFLGETITLPLVIGSALIIGSGLYVLARERRASPTLHTEGSSS